MSGFKTGRNLIVVAGVLAVTGYLRMPVEQTFAEDLQERRVMPPAIKSEVWSEMGQTSLAGAFGGLRSLMAALLSIGAHSHFEENEWYELKKDYEVITALEPYNTFYWEHGGWHMGYNAASWARHNRSFSPARRRLMEKEYMEMGDAFFHEGLKYLPDEDKLWFEIGAMWSHELKRPDYERAAEAYAMVRHSRNPVYRRFYLITLARIPGRELEAYEEAMRLLREDGRLATMTPTFRCLLVVLASNPDLPPGSLRPTVEQVFPDREKAYQDLYNYRLRVQREGFYRGRVDEMLRELIEELDVPDALNPFLTPRRRPIYHSNWREIHEQEKSEKERKELPGWILRGGQAR